MLFTHSSDLNAPMSNRTSKERSRVSCSSQSYARRVTIAVAILGSHPAPHPVHKVSICSIAHSKYFKLQTPNRRYNQSTSWFTATSQPVMFDQGQDCKRLKVYDPRLLSLSNRAASWPLQMWLASEDDPFSQWCARTVEHPAPQYPLGLTYSLQRHTGSSQETEYSSAY